MKIRHIESVTIDFDEEFITDLLMKKALDDYYDLRYGKYTNRTVTYTVGDDGKISCSLFFDKNRRNDYDKEAESEET